METLTIERTKTDVVVKTKVLEETERQVVVHCVQRLNPGDGVRIWPTTYLVEAESGKKIKLVHADNISVYPHWTVANNQQVYKFTLLFSGLSKSCKAFELIEEIPQSGGFYFGPINRNKQDVYKITFPDL